MLRNLSTRLRDLLNLRLGIFRLVMLMLALRLRILKGLDLSASLFQVGIVDLDIILVRVGLDLLLRCRARVLDLLNFEDRLRRVKLPFIIRNFEAFCCLCRVGDLLDLGAGAGIEYSAGKGGLAGQFAVRHHNDIRRIRRGLCHYEANPEGLKSFLKSLW
jgi:hypothetical protein